jgi:hypothetical protein
MADMHGIQDPMVLTCFANPEPGFAQMSFFAEGCLLDTTLVMAAALRNMLKDLPRDSGKLVLKRNSLLSSAATWLSISPKGTFSVAVTTAWFLLAVIKRVNSGAMTGRFFNTGSEANFVTNVLWDFQNYVENLKAKHPELLKDFGVDDGFWYTFGREISSACSTLSARYTH